MNNSLPTNDREAVAAIIAAMVEAGAHVAAVTDGEGETLTNRKGTVSDKVHARVLDHVTSCDDGTIRFERGDERLTVWFVLGNSVSEVAADYWPATEGGNPLAAPLEALTGAWSDAEAAAYWASPAGQVHERQLMRFVS